MAGLTDPRLYLGDARDLSPIPDGSVHLIVTSPPYWQLKDYGHQQQIGFHQSFPEYIDHLNRVWMECERVLHPGCRMCVNVGDQFARAAYYGRYKLLSIQSEVIRFLETMGMDYMGTLIWQKVTTTRTTGGANIMGSFPFPRNGMAKIDYEYILLFKKPGHAPKPSAAQKAAARMTTEEWNRYFAGHWTFPGVRQEKHLAAFPEELPARLIRMFSFPEETVFDPFAGSGTTLLAAAKRDRAALGFEIVPEYAETARLRLEAAGHRLDLVEAPPPTIDLDRLPYRTALSRDLERIEDPRRRTFGVAVERPR